MIASFLLGHWRAVGALLIVLALAGYIETLRLERDHAYAAEATAKAALATFKAEVTALGEKAKIEAEAKEAADKKLKKDADDENKATISALNARIGELRKQSRSGGGSMSPNPAGSKCPDGLTCFDRAEYQRTDGVFVAGARGLADEGTKVTADLNTAKTWAIKLDKTLKGP